jgi:hypothetical protein
MLVDSHHAHTTACMWNHNVTVRGSIAYAPRLQLVSAHPQAPACQARWLILEETCAGGITAGARRGEAGNNTHPPWRRVCWARSAAEPVLCRCRLWAVRARAVVGAAVGGAAEPRTCGPGLRLAAQDFDANAAVGTHSSIQHHAGQVYFHILARF